MKGRVVRMTVTKSCKVVIIKYKPNDVCTGWNYGREIKMGKIR